MTAHPFLFYRDGPFIKNVSFVDTQKNVIYSKFVNHTFNGDFVVSSSMWSVDWKALDSTEMKVHTIF